MPSPDDTGTRSGPMRYLTGVLRPVERLHPVEAVLAETPGVTPLAIHELKLLDDGTCIALLEVRGDPDRLDDGLGDHPPTLEYALSGQEDGFVYLQSEAHELAHTVLGIRDESELVVRMPLEHTDDGGLRGTVVGHDAAFQRAIEALPDDIEFEVESTGDYHPDVHDLFATLTDRQQEVLATAVSDGYYDDPRRTSQRDLAETLDIASGTVGQHLRRIEATVFAEFVPRGDRDGEG